MIGIKNFTKNYPGVNLYNDFSLTVNNGEITCILGESGCGKTTLLNAVAGLIGYGGYITPLKCSYVFQNPRLVPCLTVEGNLSLVVKDINKIRDTLNSVGLSGKEKSYPHELSGGQEQRVSIARAFLYDGEAFLLDEPFSSLDLKLKKEISSLFFSLWKNRSKPLLFVTHNVDEAADYADRVIILKSGKIVYDKYVVSRKNLRQELVDLLIR